jgi:hypothetical protein
MLAALWTGIRFGFKTVVDGLWAGEIMLTVLTSIFVKRHVVFI